MTQGRESSFKNHPLTQCGLIEISTEPPIFLHTIGISGALYTWSKKCFAIEYKSCLLGNLVFTLTSIPTKDEVLHAADAIIATFAATDTQNYFAGFAPDASFIFHPEPERLSSRAEYEKLWASWLLEGWKVIDCQSSDRLVQCYEGGAVFSHTVATTVDTGSGQQESYTERESIIFALINNELRAVHEHLSTITA